MCVSLERRKPGCPGALTTSLPLPQAISSRRVHDPWAPPEPRLGAIRCTGGGEGTRPSPVLSLLSLPRSASGHRYSARREACGPLEAALTATMRPTALRPALTLPRRQPAPGASSEPERRSQRGSELSAHDRSANSDARIRPRAGRGRRTGRAHQSARSSSCGLGNPGRNRFVLSLPKPARYGRAPAPSGLGCFSRLGFVLFGFPG